MRSSSLAAISADSARSNAESIPEIFTALSLIEENAFSKETLGQLEPRPFARGRLASSRCVFANGPRAPPPSLTLRRLRRERNRRQRDQRQHPEGVHVG